MIRTKRWVMCSVAASGLIGTSASGQETTTYTYDALGRLTSSSVVTGSSSTTTGTCLDPAGNRAQYSVSVNGTANCYTSTPAPSPTPTPTPTPTPSNSPPVANADSTSFHCSLQKTLNLTANDTDPENNLPLSLVSVTTNSPNIWASVISASSVSIGASYPGSYMLTYVVADSLGATSTGSVNVTVTGNSNVCQISPE